MQTIAKNERELSILSNQKYLKSYSFFQFIPLPAMINSLTEHIFKIQTKFETKRGKEERSRFSTSVTYNQKRDNQH